MDDGKPLAAEGEVGLSSIATDSQLLGVALQRGAVPVIVSPDKCAGQARQMVEHRFLADITAMNEEFGLLFLQKCDGGDHHFGAVVGIAEDAYQHKAKDSRIWPDLTLRLTGAIFVRWV